MFKHNGTWETAPSGTAEGDDVDRKYNELHGDKSDDNTDREDANKSDTDDTEVNPKYVSYNVFDPENGVVKNTIKEPYENYSPVLLETIEFTGDYKKGNSRVFIDGVCEQDGKTSGVIRHYADGETHFVTLNLRGMIGSKTYWKKLDDINNMTNNGTGFHVFKEVRGKLAYQYDRTSVGVGDAYLIYFRGKVQNGTLVELGMEGEYSAFKSSMKCNDFKYTSTAEADKMKNGKYLLERFSVKKGATDTAPIGSPEKYWGLSEKEAIDKYGYYYEPDGTYYAVVNFNSTIDGVRNVTGDLLDKIEIVIPQNMDGVSSDGKTTFQIGTYSYLDYDAETGKLLSDTSKEEECQTEILKVYGNLGEKYYISGNVEWSRPAGVIDYGSITGENEMGIQWHEITKHDGYWQYPVDAPADYTIAHFSDKTRTGIQYFKFSFGGEEFKFSLDGLDYTGALLNFFYLGAIEDNTNEIADILGLVPEDLKGLRTK